MLSLFPREKFFSIFKPFSGRSGFNFYCKAQNIANTRHIALYSADALKVLNNFSYPFRSHVFIYRHMAGHAKWQNIKHVKAEKDKQKSMMYNKYVRQVIAAVREKGPDPKGNNKLSNLLEEARKNNIPNSTLENALKRASSKKIQCGNIEMLGPGGVIVIFEYETDNLAEMRRTIKIICRKYSAGIFPANSERWRAAYEQKGVIRVSKQLNGENIDGEKMLDAAIEAGAEDVQKGEEESIYEFFSAPEDIHTVKKEIEQKFVVEEAFVGYFPISTVSLPEPDKAHALNFLNELGELPDVERLYENLE